MARKLGLDVQTLATDWRRAPQPEAIEATLSEDGAHTIKAVLLVHNETSNGVMSRVAEIRKAMDRAKHPALLMVDTISSLASADFRMDEWGRRCGRGWLAEGADAARRIGLRCDQ